MITSTSYPSSPWLVTWFFSAVTVLFLLVDNGGILGLGLFSKLSSRFAALFCKGCKRFQCGSRAASVAAAGAGGAWKPHWPSGARACGRALIELALWTPNLEFHRMFTSWNVVLLVCFGFVFELFENVEASWALPSWAEAGARAQFLALLSRIPSISLLVLLPFLCAQLNSCLSRFVRGPENSGCLGSVSFQTQFFALCTACSSLGSFCWAMSFSPSSTQVGSSIQTFHPSTGHPC